MSDTNRKTKFKFSYEVDTVLLQLIYKHRQEIYHRGSTCKAWNQILDGFNRRVNGTIVQSRTLNNRFKALRKDINLRIKSRAIVGEELNENEKMLMYLNEYFSKKVGKVIEKEKRNGLLIGPEVREKDDEKEKQEKVDAVERRKRRRREKSPMMNPMMYMDYDYIEGEGESQGESQGQGQGQGHVQGQSQGPGHHGQGHNGQGQGHHGQGQGHNGPVQGHGHHHQHHGSHIDDIQQSFSSSTRSLVSSPTYYNIIPTHSPQRNSPKIPFALDIDKDDYRGTFDMYQMPKPIDMTPNQSPPQYPKFKEMEQMTVQSIQQTQLQQTQEIQEIKKEFYSFKYEIGNKLEQILESLNRR